MTVFKALTAVKNELGAISKGDTMKGGSFSYKYRSIDDVLNKLHPILVNHGVVIVPQLLSKEQQGKVTHVIVNYLVADSEGNTVTATTPGEGQDSGDKGTNKAMTAAFKVLLTQILAIPFETDDPDHYLSNPPVSEEKTFAAKPKAPAPAPSVATETVGSGSTSKPAAPAAEGERICATCGFAIAPGDPIKRKNGQYHHKACLEPAPAKLTTPSENDIASIIDNFQSN